MTATASPTVPTGRGTRILDVVRPKRSWLPSLVGIGILLVVWQIAGSTLYQDSKVIPTPTAILSQLKTDGWSFYGPNVMTTLRASSNGWLWGNALAIVSAIAFVQLPIVERVLMQVAVASYCLPLVAIGGVMILAMDKGTARAALAAISCYFTTLIGMHVGLRSVDRASLDLVRAYGGGSWTQLTKVRLRSSLPGLFAGMRIAAPAAILGAVIGEWLGAESGLGVAMVTSQQQLNVERTWGIALVITAMSAIVYAATALVGNLLTTWAPKIDR
jgi:ABC-type nitrate/sulfonate/bicarbonate transport system permease component